MHQSRFPDWGKIILLCAGLLFSLAACSKTDSSSAKGTASDTLYSSAERTARDAENADADLIVYSPHPEEMSSFLVKEFRQRTGLHVTVVNGGTRELLEALEAGHKADVFWGGGIESLEAHKYLFEPYTYSQEELLLENSVSAEHLWTGFSQMTMVIAYNTNLIQDTAIPEGWQDLAKTKFKNQILMADPNKSGSSFSLLVTMLLANGGFSLQKETSSWHYVEKLVQNMGSRGLTAGSSDVYSAVAAGEAYFGLTFENAVLSLKNSGRPINQIYPAEGTVCLPDGIALCKGSQNKEAAVAFMEFMLGPDVQEMSRERWFRRSVRKDVAAPEGAAEMDAINKVDYNVTLAAQNQEKILALWSSILSD
ncbi:MAG: extracellular solute-binding protein [Treponemataceae bacterium]|nr:extracellular solute-binding protein [Treponemataceae bacterium]